MMNNLTIDGNGTFHISSLGCTFYFEIPIAVSVTISYQTHFLLSHPILVDTNGTDIVLYVLMILSYQSKAPKIESDGICIVADFVISSNMTNMTKCPAHLVQS